MKSIFIKTNNSKYFNYFNDKIALFRFRINKIFPRIYWNSYTFFFCVEAEHRVPRINDRVFHSFIKYLIKNSSILYADIVGFTAISSTYSAQDLVKMLNELFARFDRLAEVWTQRTHALKLIYLFIFGTFQRNNDTFMNALFAVCLFKEIFLCTYFLQLYFIQFVLFFF